MQQEDGEHEQTTIFYPVRLGDAFPLRCLRGHHYSHRNADTTGTVIEKAASMGVLTATKEMSSLSLSRF